MIKWVWATCLVAVLSGCAVTDGGRWWRQVSGQGAVASYHFNWQLSGDPDLAPLQIFDDGQDTWLQYPAGQPVPALFARLIAGDRLLRPRREGDYLVVSGVYDHLLMRGGLLQVEARRQSAAAGLSTAQALASAAPVLALSGSTPTDKEQRQGQSSVQAPVIAPEAVSPPHLPPVFTPAVAQVAPQSPPAKRRRAAPASAVAAPAVAPVFDVTPADGNVRRALGRWAHAAGWTFEAEHWAVDVDIPLAGSAAFDEPFRAAVRSLLAATELGDRPVQPCFYANQVLRVVPLTQRCDRTQETRAAS